jgi:hypothetical protein
MSFYPIPTFIGAVCSLEKPEHIQLCERSGNVSRLYSGPSSSSSSSTTIRLLQHLLQYTKFVDLDGSILPAVSELDAEVNTAIATQVEQFGAVEDDQSTPKLLARALLSGATDEELGALILMLLFPDADIQPETLDTVLQLSSTIEFNPIQIVRSQRAKRKLGDMFGGWKNSVHAANTSVNGLVSWLRAVRNDPYTPVATIIQTHPVAQRLIRIVDKPFTVAGLDLKPGMCIIYQMAVAAAKSDDQMFIFGFERRCAFADRAIRLVTDVRRIIHDQIPAPIRVPVAAPWRFVHTVLVYCELFMNWIKIPNQTVHRSVCALIDRVKLQKFHLHDPILRRATGGCPFAGERGTPFGRNLQSVDTHDLMVPDPVLVANTLMKRTEFLPSAANLWAGAWIQFMVHGWAEHVADPDIIFTTSEQERIPALKKVGTRSGQPVFLNETSHWWDASQLYGDSPGVLENGRFVKNSATGRYVLGKAQNMWYGLAQLHEVFAHEHNHVVDLLCKREGLDEQVAGIKARLVVSALLAKIHTVEWTPQVFHSDDMDFIMKTNRNGALPNFEAGAKTTGYVGKAMGGLTSMATHDDIGVPFSLTEEFVSVYRLHSLIPDTVQLNGKSVPFQDLLMHSQEEYYDPLSTMEMMSHQAAGTLELHNFPTSLMALEKEGSVVNLAVRDLLRDRETRVPRYCAFRRELGMSVPKSFTELAALPADACLLEKVYAGDLEAVDLQIGMMAEPKRTGWIVSDTAFQIFIVMASRRIEADNRLCADYGADLYTQTGYDWVESQCFADVLRRSGYNTCDGGLRTFHV